MIADLFDWRPARTYDVVFFSFWLSHVPRPRFARFWELVRSCLHDGGRAFLIDNRTDPVRSRCGATRTSSSTATISTSAGTATAPSSGW